MLALGLRFSTDLPLKVGRIPGFVVCWLILSEWQGIDGTRQEVFGGADHPEATYGGRDDRPGVSVKGVSRRLGVTGKTY